MYADPNLYDYWPYEGRPKISWRGGKKLAFGSRPILNITSLNHLTMINAQAGHAAIRMLSLTPNAHGAIRWAIGG